MSEHNKFWADLDFEDDPDEFDEGYDSSAWEDYDWLENQVVRPMIEKMPPYYIAELMFHFGEQAGKLEGMKLNPNQQRLKDRWYGKRSLLKKSYWKMIFTRRFLDYNLVETIDNMIDDVKETPLPEVLKIAMVFAIFLEYTGKPYRCLEWLVLALGQYAPGFFKLYDEDTFEYVLPMLDDEEMYLTGDPTAVSFMALWALLDYANETFDFKRPAPSMLDYMGPYYEDPEALYGETEERRELEEFMSDGSNILFTFFIMMDADQKPHPRILNAFELDDYKSQEAERLCQEISDSDFIRNFQSETGLAYSMSLYTLPEDPEEVLMDSEITGSAFVEHNAEQLYNLLRYCPFKEDANIKEQMVKEAFLLNLKLFTDYNLQDSENRLKATKQILN